MSTRTDLDLAASIIDDARHAMSPNQRGSRIVPTKRVLWSEDASRIVREWEDRKHRAAALHPRREVHVPSVDLDEATEPPTVRVWACAQCGKREPWGPGWSWYGPELLDQSTEGEQAMSDESINLRSANARIEVEEANAAADEAEAKMAAVPLTSAHRPPCVDGSLCGEAANCPPETPKVLGYWLMRLAGSLPGASGTATPGAIFDSLAEARSYAEGRPMRVVAVVEVPGE